MSGGKVSNAELVAIYRLEFYRRQKNWKLGADTRRRPASKNASAGRPLLDKTYDVERVDTGTESPLNVAFLENDTDKNNLTPESIKCTDSPSSCLNSARSLIKSHNHLEPAHNLLISEQTPPRPEHNPTLPATVMLKYVPTVPERNCLEDQKIQQGQTPARPFPLDESWLEGHINQLSQDTWSKLEKHKEAVPIAPEPLWIGAQSSGHMLQSASGWPASTAWPASAVWLAPPPGAWAERAAPALSGGAWPPDAVPTSSSVQIAPDTWPAPAPDALLAAAEAWLPAEARVPPRERSLDSLSEFVRGAHSAPHSSEDELPAPGDDGEELVDGAVARMSTRQLCAHVAAHARALRRLLREAAVRDQLSREPPRSQPQPSEDILAGSFGGEAPTDSPGAGCGRGRGRLPARSVHTIGIGMGRPYRL